MGGGIKQKGKRTHGMDNSVVIAGYEGRGVRGIKGNGKKIQLKRGT